MGKHLLVLAAVESVPDDGLVVRAGEVERRAALDVHDLIDAGLECHF